MKIKGQELTFLNCYKASKPKPVLNIDKKIALFFNAKSGCTFAVKWFFNQIDHLNVAMEYHYFVHRYRNEIYLKSKIFERSEIDFIQNAGKDYLKIKVIRNPFERAVSSYMHFLRMLDIKHPAIIKDFGVGFKKLDYSFFEFLEMLSTINIDSCDIHWKQQFQHIERILNFDFLINIKDSTTALLKLEKTFNLVRTKNIESLIYSGHHSTSKKSLENKFCGNTSYTIEVRQNRPEYKCFYNKELEEKVRMIYHLDFEKYNFSSTYLH